MQIFFGGAKVGVVWFVGCSWLVGWLVGWVSCPTLPVSDSLSDCITNESLRGWRLDDRATCNQWFVWLTFGAVHTMGSGGISPSHGSGRICPSSVRSLLGDGTTASAYDNQCVRKYTLAFVSRVFLFVVFVCCFCLLFLFVVVVVVVVVVCWFAGWVCWGNLVVKQQNHRPSVSFLVCQVTTTPPQPTQWLSSCEPWPSAPCAPCALWRRRDPCP